MNTRTQRLRSRRRCGPARRLVAEDNSFVPHGSCDRHDSEALRDEQLRIDAWVDQYDVRHPRELLKRHRLPGAHVVLMVFHVQRHVRWKRDGNVTDRRELVDDEGRVDGRRRLWVEVDGVDEVGGDQGIACRTFCGAGPACAIGGSRMQIRQGRREGCWEPGRRTRGRGDAKVGSRVRATRVRRLRVP